MRCSSYHSLSCSRLSVLICSPNHIGITPALTSSIRTDIPLFRADYPVVTWAVHRTGGIVTYVHLVIPGGFTHISCRSANPKSTATELHYHMKLTNPCLMVVHFSALENTYRAAAIAGFPQNRIIVLGMDRSSERYTISRLIDECDSLLPSVDRKLNPGEGSTKLAFLLLSSGTTGDPKVRSSKRVCS